MYQINYFKKKNTFFLSLELKFTPLTFSYVKFRSSWPDYNVAKYISSTNLSYN